MITDHALLARSLNLPGMLLLLGDAQADHLRYIRGGEHRVAPFFNDVRIWPWALFVYNH